MAPRDIVVVGAGEAGARVCVALREQGYDGALTLIGEERHLPYERPPLSKASIVAEIEPEIPTIADARRLTELGVDFISGVSVDAIDRASRRVTLADGGSRGYDKLVLATGATPRRLSPPAAEYGLTLRTHEDALILRERLRGGGKVAIIGGGFIGLELAASARALGCEVTVVEAAPRLLQRATPPELSTLVEARHRAEGVHIILGAGVAALARDAVDLTDGRRVSANTIVVGIGAAPETRLAAAAGLAIDNGIAVDGRLVTSDPDILAIGDCASFPHPLFEGRRMRLEAWRNAFDQGAFAARSLLGAEEAFQAVPWFWSDQYDQCLQIAGLPEAGALIVKRDLGEGAMLLFHIAGDGRLVAIGGWGPLGKIAKDIRVGEMLIARRASPSPEMLASPRVKLKALL